MTAPLTEATSKPFEINRSYNTTGAAYTITNSTSTTAANILAADGYRDTAGDDLGFAESTIGLASEVFDGE